MQLPDFLTEYSHGSIRLTGHRIGLLHVVQLYNRGHTPEMLAEHFPTLPLALIQRVVAFYQDNKTEVDSYVAGREAESERQRAATSGGADIDDLRKRFDALRKAEAP